jgi:hypothetical protein
MVLPHALLKLHLHRFEVAEERGAGLHPMKDEKDKGPAMGLSACGG